VSEVPSSCRTSRVRSSEPASPPTGRPGWRLFRHCRRSVRVFGPAVGMCIRFSLPEQTGLRCLQSSTERLPFCGLRSAAPDDFAEAAFPYLGRRCTVRVQTRESLARDSDTACPSPSRKTSDTISTEISLVCGDNSDACMAVQMSPLAGSAVESMTWRARGLRARRRLMFYWRAFDSATASETRPIPGEMQRLIRVATKEARSYDESRGRVSREQIRRFEAAVDELASADNWSVRLSQFLETLKTARARTALRDLVKLGCVPDMLVDCLNAQRAGEAFRRVRRTDLNAHRRKLRIVARRMNQLADLCASVSGMCVLGVGGSYTVNGQISRFLWNEARRIDAFLVVSDPRTNHDITLAEHSLFATLHDIRLITGEYQNRLVVDFLSVVFPISADALKTFRTRKATLWSSTKPRQRVLIDEFPKLVGG
jgi:hypothetical protein